MSAEWNIGVISEISCARECGQLELDNKKLAMSLEEKRMLPELIDARSTH